MIKIGRKVNACADKQVWITPYGEAVLMKVVKNGEVWQVTDELPDAVAGWLMRKVGFGDHPNMPSFPKQAPPKPKKKAKVKAKPK